MFCFYEYKYTIAWYRLQEALIRVRKRCLIYIYIYIWKAMTNLEKAMTQLENLDVARKADKPRQHVKKQRHYFANKGPSTQNYGFSSSHVWM